MSEGGESFWKNKKVLIVDDFEMVRNLVSKAMRELQVGEIVQAENGEAAYQKLIEAVGSGAPFDLVFSDWVMPVMDGLQLFEKIRGESKLAHLPFVMFTVESDQQSVVKAIQTGIRHFMVKPVLKPKLVEKLKQIEDEIAMEAKKRKYNV